MNYIMGADVITKPTKQSLKEALRNKFPNAAAGSRVISLLSLLNVRCWVLSVISWARKLLV